jgi:hypothetical protein
VFADLREVQHSAARPYADLAAYLDGRGVPSVDEALREVLLRPVQAPFEELVSAELFQRLTEARAAAPDAEPDEELLIEVEAGVRRLVEAARELSGSDADPDPIVAATMLHFEALMGLPAQAAAAEHDGADPQAAAALEAAAEYLDGRPERWIGLLGWVFVRSLGALVDPDEPAEQSRSWFDEWLFGRALQRAATAAGLSDEQALLATTLTRVLLAHDRALWAVGPRPTRRVLETLLRDVDVQELLQVNRYREVLWFSKERFEELTCSLLLAAAVQQTAEAPESAPDLSAQHRIVEELQAAERESGYQVERLLGAVAA